MRRDRRRFAKVWEMAVSAEEVAATFEMTAAAARALAYRLRRAGVKLKRFKPGPAGLAPRHEAAPADDAPLSEHDALVHIVNVLGPNSFGCPTNTCDGCDWEGNEALLTARRALGISDGTTLNPRRWP